MNIFCDTSQAIKKQVSEISYSSEVIVKDSK